MIVLRVLSYNGAPAEGPQAQFDELGGTIGRADNNQLVLPDPERTISRVHARVVFRGGGYAVVDNGSNPISVNGAVIGAGREHPLKIGDELQIGGYLLVAEVAGAPKSDDPFADLFGDTPVGLAAPPPPPPLRTAPPPARTAMPSSAATATWPPPAAPAPWRAAPPPPPAAWAPPPPAPRAPAAAGPAVIPEDWDPFADPVEAPAPAAAAPMDVFASLPSGSGGGGDSLDDLFGLGSVAPGADPLGGPPQQALRAQPNTAQHGDVLQSLARTATLMPPSQADHASELNTPMILPQVQASAPALAPAQPPQGAVFSWNDPPRDGRVVTLPGQPRPSAPRPPAAVAPAATSAAAVPVFATGPAPAPARAPQAPPAAPGPGDAALLQAFLQGLGVPGLRMEGLTTDSMHLLGQLLRESTRGTVELLVARAALKREMRAEMTMIVSRENNPLKFSPTVEVALQHLLGPPAPGFMPPAQAMRDAFDDLRAHQLGVMAGMRAALEGVLQRFNPQQLEGKLSKRSAIDSIIPATRKARLWEAFNELFAQLQTEAQDDFDELFGKAFLKAYEDQLDRLHNEAGPR